MAADTKVQHVFIHPADHIRCAVDLPHEIDGFRTTPHSDAEAVGAWLFKSRGWDVVFWGSVVECRDGMRFHSDQLRVVEYAHRDVCRSKQYQLIEAEIQRQRDFSVGPTHIVNQKLGLQIKQVFVTRYSALGDIDRVHVSEVPVAIEVAAFPHAAAIWIDEGDIQPKLRLGPQRS